MRVFLLFYFIMLMYVYMKQVFVFSRMSDIICDHKRFTENLIKYYLNILFNVKEKQYTSEASRLIMTVFTRLLQLIGQCPTNCTFFALFLSEMNTASRVFTVDCFVRVGLT